MASLPERKTLEQLESGSYKWIQCTVVTDSVGRASTYLGQEEDTVVEQTRKGRVLCGDKHRR
jgi:hypothetical protein